MASSSGKSDLGEQDADAAKARRLLQLDCVNRSCKNGDNQCAALYFVCSYYNVTWKRTKKVCEECLMQCLQHYKRLELKFKNKECILDEHFPSYDAHMIIESSSSEDEEPMPSTSKQGLPPDEELQTAVTLGLDLVLEENKELIDAQIKLCNDYLDKDFEECMREADSIDAIASKLENDIKLLKSELYDPYKPITTMLSSDSEQESVEEVIDVEEIEDVQIETLIDSSDNNEKAELEANKDKKIDNKRKGETEKFEQNKVVVAVEDKETDQDIISVEDSVFVTPSDLPNEGPLSFPPLRRGQKVLAMQMSLMQPWCTHTVIAVHNEKTVHIRSDVGDKLVATNLVAYPTQCPVQFRVGTRVVANFIDEFNFVDCFYAGIIAEPPTLLNKFRYLIFFDNRKVQYVYHKNIRLIVGQTSDGLCFNVDPDFRKFIKSYVDQYPDRAMVKLTNGHTVKVQYENKWVSAKVVEVDASLVKLYFTEKKCFEWLYRGSPRLWKMFEKLLNLEKGIRSRQSGLVYLKRPFVEYSTIEIPTPPARTVARKSTSKKSTTSQHEKVKKSIPTKNESDLKLLSLPKDCFVPKKIVLHTCSYLCVKWTDYNYMKTKQINMLAVPLNFAFRRCQWSFNISQKCIVYKTPCGLSIRSLKEMHHYLMKTKSMMTIDQFDFNSWVNPFAEFNVGKNYYFSQDMSEGKEFKGISVVNTINYNTPPNLKYMTVRQAMPGVNINVENEFLCGCDCTDNCQDKSKCACWQLTIEGQKILPNLDQDPDIGYSHRRLPERVLTGIYECNKTCKCSKSCLNRVVQNPLSQKLQLFLTEKKGWGVRCLNDIPHGSFICIYVGYLLTETDANEGGINYGDEYLAELDYIEVVEKIKEDYETDVPLSDNEENLTNSESSSEDLQTTVEGTNFTYQLRKRQTSKTTTNTKNDGLNVRNPSKMKNNPKPPKPMREYFGNNESVYIMDAKTSGNIGRYLNHSCSPNVFVQNVFVDTHDLRFPWVSFFALHYIPAGTELTWDYNYDIGSVPGKMMKCHCESTHCRGRLL